MAERVAIYPGSFDPITLGHLNLVERGLTVFDRLIVAVVKNPNKQALFSPEERVEIIQEAINNDPRVTVESFEGLLVDYCQHHGTNVVLRGLRAVSDFEYEFEMALMWRNLAPDIDIVCMMSALEYQFVYSSRIKEVALLGGDIGGLVPLSVTVALKEKLGPPA